MYISRRHTCYIHLTYGIELYKRLSLFKFNLLQNYAATFFVNYFYNQIARYLIKLVKKQYQQYHSVEVFAMIHV